MKSITLILLLFLSLNTFGNEKIKINILTSLDPNEGKSFFNSKNYDNNKIIEKEFVKHFNQNDFAIKITNNSRLSDIYETLNDPTVTAVFFIGHGGVEASVGSSSSINSPAIIADENLNDLKNAFQKVHTHLKFLSIISCNSKKIIDPFISAGYYKNASELHIKTFDKKIKLLDGIHEAITESAKVFGDVDSFEELNQLFHPVYPFDNQEMGEIKINSTKYLMDNKKINEAVTDMISISRISQYSEFDQELPSALILINGKVVGYFPKGRSGKRQETKIALELSMMDKTAKLQFDTGYNSYILKNKVDLGELEIEPNNENCVLKTEKNSKGALLGVGKNFYKLYCRINN